MTMAGKTASVRVQNYIVERMGGSRYRIMTDEPDVLRKLLFVSPMAIAIGMKLKTKWNIENAI